MKRYYGIAAALLVGAALGALATRVVEAQKPLPGFFIAEVSDITNQQDYATYAAGVPATLQKYGGRYLVRGGRTETLEGDPPKRIVVTVFPSMADARRWYSSPEYSAIMPIRLRSAKARGFIVEGLGE